MNYPRLVIGRDQMSPFAGISCGDVFRDTFGKTWVWDNQTLYFGKHEGDEVKPDYRHPHPYFTNVDGFIAFVQRVNYFANNPEEYKSGKISFPVGFYPLPLS